MAGSGNTNVISYTQTFAQVHGSNGKALLHCIIMRRVEGGSVILPIPLGSNETMWWNAGGARRERLGPTNSSPARTHYARQSCTTDRPRNEAASAPVSREGGFFFGCCRQRNNLIFLRPRDPASAIGHCKTRRKGARNRGLCIRERSLDAPLTRLMAPPHDDDGILRAMDGCRRRFSGTSSEPARSGASGRRAGEGGFSTSATTEYARYAGRG